MAKKGGFVRRLPSAHMADTANIEAAMVAQNEEKRRKEARVLAAFDWLLKQENGRVVWGWLFSRCGYNKPVLMRVAGGDVAPLSTDCAAAQREVYREMRLMISAPELLAQAEYEAEFGVKPAPVNEDKKGEKK